MKKFLFSLFLFVAYLPSHAQENTHIHESFHMGSPFAITVVHSDREKAWEAIEAAEKEIERIEALISSWRPTSQTSSINKHAGLKAVKVSEELFQLIYRAKKVSQLSQGAFDISYASMDRIWKFDGTMTQMPSPEAIAKSVEKIGYQQIELQEARKEVFLQRQGMKIGFGAMGKGYAANRAKAILQAKGISSGMVNAGGDLTAWGKEENGESWKIAIADPSKKKTVLAWLELSDQAVVTSGDYERFVEIEGKRYAHIIDPRTGYPVQGIKSVSIICPDAELADALATCVFVMGREKGLKLIEKLQGIECLIITDENEIVTSNKLKLSYE
ncbi:MAG: FAD:protein FMN transferase [Bacteroidota bacterium]